MRMSEEELKTCDGKDLQIDLVIDDSEQQKVIVKETMTMG